MHACTAHSIRVSNVPTAVDDATADVTMFLILGALRGFNIGMARLRKGQWNGQAAGAPLGHDPEGKTLGILGMGGVGRTLKRRTDAFDMKVIYHNRNQLPPHLEGGAVYVSFDELLAQSDVISLNLPLNVSFYFFLILSFIVNCWSEIYIEGNKHHGMQSYIYPKSRLRCS